MLVLFFFASTVAAVLCFRFLPPPLTPLMAIRCLDDIFTGHLPKLTKDWTRLDRISPRLAEAVIASEDQRFFDHKGFDWDAIRSAFTVNGRGKRKIGASTITQQTAKNLFLWPDRSWTRKGLEAYFTFLLELLWSKQRILEMYLNIIETGDGMYGAEAAARRYFQVTSSQLTAPQAALLAAILPNPRAWSPANPTGYLRRRQTWILRQMDQLGPLPQGLSRNGSDKSGGNRSPANPSRAPGTAGESSGVGASPSLADPAATPGFRAVDTNQGSGPKADPKSPTPDSAGPPFPEAAPGKSPDAGIVPNPASSPSLSPSLPVPAPDSGHEPAR